MADIFLDTLSYYKSESDEIATRPSSLPYSLYRPWPTTGRSVHLVQLCKHFADNGRVIVFQGLYVGQIARKVEIDGQKSDGDGDNRACDNSEQPFYKPQTVAQKHENFCYEFKLHD